MKKLMFVATFALLVLTGFDKPYSQKPKGEDDRISITVDSVERADLFPERLKEIDILSGKPRYQYRPPGIGNDLVFVHINIVEKRDLRIESSEFRLTDIYLIDDSGDSYKAIEGKFTINITLKGNKSGYYIFEMPKNKTPVLMQYSYQYREEPPKPQKILIGQIEIKL
jgi:hypothetical protein